MRRRRIVGLVVVILAVLVVSYMSLSPAAGGEGGSIEEAGDSRGQGLLRRKLLRS